MGHIFLLSGASGVGKTTFLHEVRKSYGPDKLRIIPRHTERPQRPGEENDFEYHFLSHRDFLSKVYANDFIHVERWGSFYTGIDTNYIDEALSLDQCSIVLASVYGAVRLMASYPSGLTHLYMWTGTRKSLLDPSCTNIDSPEVEELIFRIRKKTLERGYSAQETESLVSNRFAEKRMVDNFIDIAAANGRLRNREELKVLSNYRDKVPEVVDSFKGVFEGTHFDRIFGRDQSLGCFVLMPFASEFTPIYEDHIVPICGSLGIPALRADGIFSNTPIIDDIRESVASAKVVIADLTTHNPNVFYEIGICHAIGKQVVLISQSENIPFDLRHLRCIIYKYTPPGMKRFENALTATLQSVLARQQ